MIRFICVQWEEGALTCLATAAGLEPLEIVDVEVPYDLPDEAEALRCLPANGPAVIAMRAAGAERVREAVLQAIAPFRTPAGGYRLENRVRTLTARRRESTL